MKELNLSLMISTIVASLPIWEWGSQLAFLTGVAALTIVVMMLIIWLNEKKKNLVAATTKVR